MREEAIVSAAAMAARDGGPDVVGQEWRADSQEFR